MAIEQIHIGLMQEQSRQIAERTGRKNHLDHIYTAYVCAEDDFETEYSRACQCHDEEQELKAHGIALGDTVMGRHIQFMREIGKFEFARALHGAVVHELQMRGHEIYGNWAYLAHMHLGASNASELIAQALGGHELEVRMRNRGIQVHNIEGVYFQKLYRSSIHAYRCYTDGIC